MCCRRDARPARAFTLLEILIVVAVLGIAAAMVIPAMGQTGVLRVQAAVRSIVSDMTFAQADAMAYQERRAIIFDVDESTYRLVAVPGDEVEPETNTLYDPTRPDGLYVVDFQDDQFGGSRIVSAVFDDDATLIFDSLGGPVADASGSTPGNGGQVLVTGVGQTYRVAVEAFTGRVMVERVDDDGEEGEGGGVGVPGS